MKIPFSPPDISELEIKEVAEALKSGWITTGPKTKALEKKIASELKKMLENEREKYEQFFKAFGAQLKWGIYSSYGWAIIPSAFRVKAMSLLAWKKH